MLPQKRKSEIKKAVLTVLLTAGVQELPVDLNAILNCYDWCCVTFADAIRAGVHTVDYEDGYTIAENVAGKWLFTILYKDTLLPQRIRWTISHEIGHIALGHIQSPVPHQTATDEAQYFAEQLLSPVAVVAKLGARTAEDIARLCNISMDAAGWRMDDLQRHFWYREKYGYTADDTAFLTQFRLD